MAHGPLKIVLIRSGRYDYAEVELKGSLQIVGPNNTGKTTLINTLQFLYVDDLRTMSFGSYTLEQTLSYYFPGQYSYVLFECLGATGNCVMGWRGQSQVSGGDPERFCYQGVYDAGDYLAADGRMFEPRDVLARLAVKGYRVLKSAQEHREFLLPPAGGDGRGIGLIVLRDPDRFRRFRESLKDLLNLSGISQEQMRERLLTLADVRTDAPALDVRRLFGEDYDRIRSRRDALARFRKHAGRVEVLIQRHRALRLVRGDMARLWPDLKGRKAAFIQAHETALTQLKDSLDTGIRGMRLNEETLRDRREARDANIGERARLEARLEEIDRQGRALADFNPDLAQAARSNLKRDELRIAKALSEGETEARDKAAQKVSLYADLKKRREQAIANFDRLLVTGLRKRFSDDELGRAFRLLNFELLETPCGPDGVELREIERADTLLRQLAASVRDGIYEGDYGKIVLRPVGRGLADLADVERLRESLRDDDETLARWQGILRSIDERERLAVELRGCQADLATLERQMFAHEEHLRLLAERPKLEQGLKAVRGQMEKLGKEIEALERQRQDALDRQRAAEMEKVRLEDGFNDVMGRFGLCRVPDFAEAPSVLLEIPAAFDAAISLFLQQQEEEWRLREEVERELKTVAQLVGEEYNGAEDAETVGNLDAELQAVAVKTEALERDWNALIQGLRGTFAGVLKELDAVRMAVTDLNRQFGRVQVSNLKSVRLELFEAGDLVSWVRRLVDLQQPGLFDDDTQLDQTLRNFRQKLEGSPLIYYSQLLSLGLTVEGEDSVRRHYQDLKQIESHGTTIAIKVLFNLLVLRRYLKEDQCLVPFFLDEVQALDPLNRRAIMTTARRLGFIAITAAPESVTEVDALYFLQAHKGRIVLKNRHRVDLKLATAPAA